MKEKFGVLLRDLAEFELRVIDPCSPRDTPEIMEEDADDLLLDPSGLIYGLTEMAKDAELSLKDMGIAETLAHRISALSGSGSVTVETGKSNTFNLKWATWKTDSGEFCVYSDCAWELHFSAPEENDGDGDWVGGIFELNRPEKWVLAVLGEALNGVN